MRNILFIHQSAELYGSDRTLLLLLKHLDKTKFKSVVILPFDGPLKVELERENIKVVVAPVLKLYRKMFSPKNIFQFFKDIKKGFNTIDNLNKEYKFDFIYSNTLAVLLGVFYAKKSGIKHLWHIHEIIESPKIFMKLFCQMLSLKYNSKIVYNSNATKNFWNVNKRISSKSEVVWNGLEVNQKSISNEEYEYFKKEIFNSNSSEIIITLIGRISRLKGHKWLLSTYVNKLFEFQNIKILFVGSPVEGQEYYLTEIEQFIIDNKLENKVKIIPFTKELVNLLEHVFHQH